MPPKRKFNSRFPAARIKKIMQSDDEIGKVSAPVPVVMSRAVEIFLESLLTKSHTQISTGANHVKILTPAHLKRCIESEQTFDFLKDLVQHIPDILPSSPEPSRSPDELAIRPANVNSSCNLSTGSHGTLAIEEPPKRKRGRPPKDRSGEPSAPKKPKPPQKFNPDGTVMKSKRGRKPKHVKLAELAAEAHDQAALIINNSSDQNNIQNSNKPTILLNAELGNSNGSQLTNSNSNHLSYNNYHSKMTSKHYQPIASKTTTHDNELIDEHNKNEQTSAMHPEDKPSSSYSEINSMNIIKFPLKNQQFESNENYDNDDDNYDEDDDY